MTRNSARKILLSAMFMLIPAMASAQISDKSSVAGKPRSGGAIAIAINASDLSSLNNAISSTVGPIYIAPIWNDGLTSTDGEGRTVYRLAKEITISEDRKKYTIQLKDNLKWSDGQAFTASDIHFNLTQMTKYNRNWKVGRQVLDGVEIIDDRKISLSLKQPFAPMLKLLDRSAFPLLPKHIYEKGDPATNPANREPVGMGPFKFKSWAQGQRIIFERNPHYWDAPRPYLDQVVVALIPSEQQQANALLNGEVQWVMLGSSQIERVANNGPKRSVKVWGPKYGTPAVMVADFNTSIAPFSDPLVRRALYQAIDRDQILRDAYHNRGKVAKSAIPQDFKDLYDPSVDYTRLYPYDPDAAGKLLDKAGYPLKNGTRLKVTITTASGVPSYPFEATARIMAAQWQKLGIDTKIEQFDLGAYAERVYKKREFEVSLIALSAELDPVIGIDRSYRCNKTNLAYVNPTGFCDPQLDNIAEAASQASSTERMALYKKYEEMAAQSLPQIPLVEAVKSQGISTKLQGLEQELDVSYSTYANWANVWIPK